MLSFRAFPRWLRELIIFSGLEAVWLAKRRFYRQMTDYANPAGVIFLRQSLQIIAGDAGERSALTES